MKKDSDKVQALDDQIGCIGEFDVSDEICTKYCALSLKCAIEYQKNVRLEFIEDIVTSNSTYIKIQ